MEDDSRQDGEAQGWELCKENYVPVKTGRARAVLGEVADPADGTTRSLLEQRQRELQRDVDAYNGDDPIQPWLRLVKWTQEHLVGGSKAELQAVLHTATTRLLRHPHYADDKRFLRLWIQYADCLPDPTDVFLFLRDKRIGLSHGLYYEAYATFLELRGNCLAAEAVYRDGIARQAHPVERLKQKQAAFQTRMAQRAQRQIQEAAATGLTAAAEGGQPRPFLAPLATGPAAAALLGARPGTATSVPRGSLLGGGAPLAATSAAAPPLLGVSHPPQPPPAPGLGAAVAASRPHALPSAGQARGGSRAASLLFQPPAAAAPQPLSIATDDEFRSGPGPSLPGYATMPQGVGTLPHLNPFHVMRKENHETPAVWAGSALPQATAGPYACAPPPRLDICVDEEFEDGSAARSGGAGGGSVMAHGPLASVAGAQTLSSVLQARAAGGEVPLVLAPVRPPVAPIATGGGLRVGTSSGPRPTAQDLIAGRGPRGGGRPAPQSQAVLQPAGPSGQPGPILASAPPPPQRQQATNLDDEPSLEERRAVAWMSRHGASLQAVGRRLPPEPAWQPLPTPTPPVHRDDDLTTDSFLAPDVALAGPPPAGLEPTVTIATRAAFDALNDMFGPSAAAAARPSAKRTAPEGGAAALAAPDVAAQRASAAPTSAPTAHRATGPAEPTVTLNTRAAFNALNDMWSEALPHEARRQTSGSSTAVQRPPPGCGPDVDEDHLKMPGLPASMKPISALDVCRLANRGLGGPAGRPSLGPGAPGTAAMASDPCSLSIHEDTELLQPMAAAAHDAGYDPVHRRQCCSSQPGRQGLGSAGGGGAAMALHEDTCLIAGPPQGRAAAAPPPGGLLLHEDTQFFSGPPPGCSVLSGPSVANAMLPARAADLPAQLRGGGIDASGSGARPAQGFATGGKENRSLLGSIPPHS